MPNEPSATPHDRIPCACHAILQMAFEEIRLRASSILVNIVVDAGPRDGSPSALAGPLLALAGDANCFFQTKIRFKYQKAPEAVAELVKELQRLMDAVMDVARDVDSVERSRNRRRTWWGKTKRFFVGDDDWTSVLTGARNAKSKLEEIVTCCERAQTKLANLPGA